MELGGTFNCNGKVNLDSRTLDKSSKFMKTEINNIIFATQERPYFSGDVMLFDNVFPSSTAALNLKHLSKCIEMKLKLLNRLRQNDVSSGAEMGQSNFYLARKNICECLVYIRSYMQSIKWEENLIMTIDSLIGEDFHDLLLVLKKFLRELKAINESIFHYAAFHPGNKPNFHLYHLHLELRWLVITLLHAKECPTGFSSQADLIPDSIHSLEEANLPYQSTILNSTIAAVVEDLIYVANKLFDRILMSTLHTYTPYSCTCVQELWLMLQIFIDDLALKHKSKSFWQYVNESLDTTIATSTDTEASSSWTKAPINNFTQCRNPEVFGLWLIYHLTLLYGFNSDGIYVGPISARVQPNYVQVEKILKVFVNKGGKVGERDEIDEELQAMIPLLTVLTCEYWQPRVQIVCQLWECFHRRLDQPFLLQTTGPWSVLTDKKGPGDILAQVKQRLDSNFEQNKMSSYGLFLRLLGTFLRKSVTTNDFKYWNQMKGRIYSKFTNSKVAEFTEAGLYNFISLFITLALTTNTLEVCTIMLELLPSEFVENQHQKRRILVWKGELAVLLVFAERKISFAIISERFLKKVDMISCCKDETSRIMLAAFVDVLDEILRSSERLELSEHSFVGGWLNRYFLECSRNKVKILIMVLINVFKRCDQLRSLSNEINLAETGFRQMLEALWMHVAGRVRTLVFDAQIYGDHHECLSELAVIITLEALRDPAVAARHQHKFVKLFKHFSSSPMIKDIRIIRSYLTLILENKNAVYELKKQIPDFDAEIIQAWIKCCVLKCDMENHDSDTLMCYVMNSDEIIQMFQTKSELIALRHSREPILLFIRAIMNLHHSFQTVDQFSLGIKCRKYFAQIEKWGTLPITEEAKETELTNWIYRCIGTLICCCSPMLYVKTQRNSMLLALIKNFMLPDNRPLFIMNAGKKIFSKIISGIGTLDIKGDLSLQSLLKNLFDSYLPHLITDASKTGSCKISDALLNCFSDNRVDYIQLLIEKLAVNYIVCRDGKTNEHCYLVMLLLKYLVNNGDMPAVIDMIISTCLPNIITCYMRVHDLHTHRQQTIDFMATLMLSRYSKEESKRREQIKQTLMNTAQKYLTTTTKVFYEFMTSICKVIPETIPFVCSKIEQIVRELETKKHSNIAALRFSLHQLQKNVQSPGHRRFD